jgi:hypothetical protein
MTSPHVLEPRTPIEIGEARLWNESQYMWWYDQEAGVAGFHRVAHLPNDGLGKAQVWQAIVCHDGRRFRRCDTVRFQPEWRADGAFRAEGLEMRLRDGGLRVAYESPDCGSDISFTDFHDPVDPGALASDNPDGGVGNQDVLYAGHVEVGGSVTGSVRLGEETVAINGLGFRDHSWGGQRDMRPIRSTRWANGTTGPGFSFGLVWLTTSAFSTSTFGFVVRDGEPVNVPSFDLVVDVDLDDISWRTATLDMRCADGSDVSIEFGPTFDGLLFEAQEWMAFDTAAPMSVDGEPGVANIEISTNARGGLEFPRTVLRACHLEGLTQRPGTGGS